MDQDERFRREKAWRRLQEVDKSGCTVRKAAPKPTHTILCWLAGLWVGSAHSRRLLPMTRLARLTRPHAAKRLEFRSRWLLAAAGSMTAGPNPRPAINYQHNLDRTYLIPAIKINTFFLEKKKRGAASWGHPDRSVHLFIYSSSGHLSGLPESTITLLVGVLFFFYDPSTLSCTADNNLYTDFVFFNKNPRGIRFYSGPTVGHQ